MSLQKATKNKIIYSEVTAHLFCPDDDLRGRKFGRLTVVQYSYKRNKIYYYKCVCDCGKECVKSRGYLIYESSSIHKSCGCWRKEEQRKYRLKTYDFRKGTPTHNSWSAMRQRCNDPQNRAYANYGGRGIKVCDRWQNFENFLADMGKKPSPKHSIDRINVNGDYCPENCRWATIDEQANNKRNCIMVTHNGKTQNFKQWCEELNLPYYCAISMYKRGKRTFAEIIDFYKGK